jgi:hypothetical protein
MTLLERIDGFAELGNRLQTLPAETKKGLFLRANQENPWFTDSNIALAVNGISEFLEKEKLQRWLSAYRIENTQPKKIGIAMAGNIPMVGFHDLLCVLVTGNMAVAKLSSQDCVLMKFVCELLKQINPSFTNQILFEERLKDVDAVIATGSDNTARYFEYYFRNIPHLIRKNRSSCAVIMGEESEKELIELGKDVFSYFGLGCRNVSKLYVPEGFDIKRLMKAWEVYLEVVNHHKYSNNYTYQRTILLMNLIHFYDNGAVILIENNSLVSPISLLYYEYYQSLDDLKNKVHKQTEKIQCIVSANGWYNKGIPFGRAQHPQVWEYADNVDTIKFLTAVRSK